MDTLDRDLFLALNFDGGDWLDRLMLTISGTAMWIPLYLLIIYSVARNHGWQRLLLFVLLLGASMGLADIIAGIFKHSGLLGDLLPNFTPRLRPMFDPTLEGLDISPDSLRILRKHALLADATVHAPIEAIQGRYGTVSAHASTVCALCYLSASVLRKRWFTILMIACTVLICYSRIYLAKHFPMDILYGALLGIALGWLAMRGFAVAAPAPRNERR